MVELLPYNWEWKGVSRIYKNITSSMGDIHHFAWRAKHPKWAVYPSPHEARYAEWTAEECVGRCVHTDRSQSTDAGGRGMVGKRVADGKLTRLLPLSLWHDQVSVGRSAGNPGTPSLRKEFV